ncbi:S53 family peptidase [Flexivirga lutea]
MKTRQIAAGAVALTAAVGMTVTATTGPARAADRTVRLTNSGRASIAVHDKLVDRGAVASHTLMHLSLQVPLRNERIRQDLLRKGAVISPQQYDRLFAASPADLRKVAAWATDHGLRVTATDATSGAVQVTGTAAAINKAFRITLRTAHAEGRTGIVPDNAPAVPASLGISGVSGLSTLGRSAVRPQQQLQVRREPVARHTLGSQQTAAAANNQYCSKYWGQNLAVTAHKYAKMSNYQCPLSPQQAVKIYGMSGAANATPSLGILLWGDDPNALTNANVLSGAYGYPKLTKYSKLVAKPNARMADCEDGSSEQNLDVQSTHDISPKAAIRYYGAASCYFVDTTAMLAKAVAEHKVTTVSMSFGGPEKFQDASDLSQFNRVAAQAALTGISVIVCSMDSGDYSTDPDVGARTVAFPASSPFVTAVGGTAVGLTSSGGRAFTLGWASRYWDQPNAGNLTRIKRVYGGHNSIGAGGGVSAKFAQPAWQRGKVTGTTTKRAMPDVAALADPVTGLAIAYGPSTAEISIGGGTSQATPLVAAMVGVSKSITKRQVGNAAPYFYKLAGSSAIRDVTGPTGTYGAWFGTWDNGDQVIVGVGDKPDSLTVAKAWDDITGVGEPTGQGFLTGFGR